MFKYQKLANILKKVIEQGKQLKSVLYNSRQLKKSQIGPSYSLLSLLINNYSKFWDSHERISDRSKVEVGNPYLLMVMLAEYINTGRIVGGGKLKRVITQNLDCLPQVDIASKINKRLVQVRLRKNHHQFSQMETALIKWGQKDSIVPNLYNLDQQSYSNLTQDKQLRLLASPACVVQSMSSALPSVLLLTGVEKRWKGRNFDVIDACSAPGNKTIQLAQYIGSINKVFAFQKNEQRFNLLTSTLKKYQVTNVHPLHQDFLAVQPHKRYRRVKFVLLDPSCSGSGMLSNFSRDAGNTSSQNITEQKFQNFCLRKYNQLDEEQKQRVQKLHQFQLQLLTHAATFSPLRLSYSTCSIYQRENEDVVSEFLSIHPHYRIKPIKLEKQGVISGFGALTGCVRVDPRGMMADGFFVCILTRGPVKLQH